MQGKEDRVHIEMEELNQRKNTMSWPEKIKTAAEMKNLQSGEKAMKEENIARQAQLEPLQEKDEQLFMDIGATK
jgi:hypothetical protein